VSDYSFEDIVTRAKSFVGDADVGNLDTVARESVANARDEILSRATFWWQCDLVPYVQELPAYSSTLSLPEDYIAPLGVAIKYHIDASDSIVNHRWQRAAGTWAEEDVGWKPLQYMDIMSAMQRFSTIPAGVTLSAAQAASLSTGQPEAWIDEGSQIRLVPLTDKNIYVGLYYYKRLPKLQGNEKDYLTKFHSNLLFYGAMRDLYLWRGRAEEAKDMRFEFMRKLGELLEENKARKRTLQTRFEVGFSDRRSLTQLPPLPTGHAGW